MPMIRRSAPPASVTASVVSVAMRPAPAKTVGRYCPTLTAKPTAQRDQHRAKQHCSLTRRKIRKGEAPRAAAARAKRGSRLRHGSASDRKT